MELTPIEKYGNIWIKRDDLFTFNGLKGAKVRNALFLIKDAINKGFKHITSVGHRDSPQLYIVGKLCEHFGLHFVGHTTMGVLPDHLNGFEIIQHKPGYNNVIQARCVKFAKENNYYLIPFGMENFVCSKQLIYQVSNLKNVPAKRIVITVGGGINLCGLVWGLQKYEINIPIIGIVIGKNPEKLMNTFAPKNWKAKVQLVDANQAYNKHIEQTLYGIKLDPVYEAKCFDFIEDGDLFWIIGVRTF